MIEREARRKGLPDSGRISIAMRLLARREWIQLAALALLVMCFTNCRRRPAETSAAIIAAGEPEVYSATVTRLAIDGEVRETTASRVARRGDWRREQWTEAGGARALILRPDLGKGYLLDLDHRLYVEFDFAASYAGSAPTDAAREAVAAPGSESDLPAAINANEVDRALSDAPAPVQVEARVLADQTVQDHACQVIEERATMANGRIEVTRSRRARDLAGLPLLIELESASGARLTIERRDISLDVSNDDFAVPADFRKVDRLPAALKK
ncbi:MAG: hypothetical protein V7641_2523 [Blastocatellia bacterium]